MYERLPSHAPSNRYGISLWAGKGMAETDNSERPMPYLKSDSSSDQSSIQPGQTWHLERHESGYGELLGDRRHETRSGSANLHSAISGNSGHDAGLEAVWREGVFDGQEIGAAHPPHPQSGIQGTRSAGGAARRQDDG